MARIGPEFRFGVPKYLLTSFGIPNMFGTMTDFSTIVSDLRAAGMTQLDIARMVGAGVSTISNIADGKTRQPRYATAVRLLELHAERCVQNARRKRAGGGRNK